MPIEMTFPPVSFLQFMLTLIIGIAMVFILALYLGIFVWIFGKPLRLYLIAKFTPGTGIIQEYTHEGVTLKLAREKDGEFNEI